MLVPLRSVAGGKRLKEIERCSTRNIPNDNNDGDISLSTTSAGHLQKQVIVAFRKQIGNTHCGLASLAILLTAAKRDAYFAVTQGDGGGDKGDRDRGDIAMSLPLSPYYVHEDDIYPMVAYCIYNKDNNSNLNLVSDEKIRRSGMTLDQITSLAGALPSTKKAISFFPSTTAAAATSRTNLDDCSNFCNDVDGDSDDDDDNDKNTVNINDDDDDNNKSITRVLSGPNELRKLICNVLSKPTSINGLILNYHMTTIGQIPFNGHLSPIAVSDCFSFPFSSSSSYLYYII